MASGIFRTPNIGQPMWFEYRDDEVRKGKTLSCVCVCAIGNKVATICHIYTRPKQRRKGYATKLVEFLKENFGLVQTQLSASGKESVAMLEKCGFEKEGNLLVWKS